ncbi:hypothetical protein AB0D04_11980 [Streptomyces sp. NPDC048483]|uniref:hypothetical protein n=1 Tax=Streptomyces sp. NPDC048483 TaxID=3154927 RepID=UPI00343A1D25
MTYRLNAVIGDFDRLRSWAGTVPRAVVAPLSQRMGLMPLTKALLHELPQTLGELSRCGPIAHVEADFWGGDGEQTASLWRDGERVWGPEHTSAFTGPRQNWPINAALARLGAAPAGPDAPDHQDLFLEVGLGRGRDEEDWRGAALEAHDAANYDEWYANVTAERERTASAAAERAKYERLPHVPVALNGRDIMALLGMPRGRMVGAAMRHLQELHLQRGPLSQEAAEAGLRAWAEDLPGRPDRADEGPAPARP